LTGISSYFFRVIASNQRQVFIGTRYAEQMLHATRAALFVDPNDLYSKEVAYDFEQQFVNDGKAVVAVENYSIGHQEMIAGLLQDAFNKNPDLIYFSGNANDASSLMGDLPTTGQYAHLQVMGAGLFTNYPASLKPRLNRLHFTVFLTGGMWESNGLSAKKPAFFTEYPQDFDPLKQHNVTAFGYTRADNDVMFSYDAMLALLTGSKIALAGLPAGKQTFTPGNLQLALTKITGSQAFQGVSGQISFGPDGNIVNKTTVLVKFDAKGDPLIDSVQGSFLVGS
jgi:ABC-type branched-subunit amino acid transport system substrate-binding protein